ncbi:MAG: SCO family protein [Brumimicrobium sp.]|nr:SCO family protein [Brumimicrobium sp.]MCO5267575.1 SCO family protein [Brumimicrobium sp.]
MRKGTLISICIVIVGIIIAYSMIKSNLGEKELPIIQPVDVNSEMVNPEIMNQGLGHRIGEFEFRNQYNQKVSLQDVKGKIFIAEYFFTTCQTICPIMTDEMMRVQSRFRGNDEVKILSFTVDPDIDTVETLKAYAEKHQAQKGQWHFLTGKKEELYQLARNSFFVLKPAEARNLGDANSDFIHTNNFVLVDRALQIRGYYDGTNPQEVNTLMDDIDLLLKEK